MRLGVLALMTMVSASAGAQGLQYRVLNWPQKPEQGQAWELRLQGRTDFENPFDPRQIDIELEIRTPAGARQRVPAFWFQDYGRTLEGGDEELTPQGEAEWRVRYTPRESGEYRCRATAQAGQESWAGEWRKVRVAKGRDDFLKVASNRRYFETGDARPYFAIGENVCWPGTRGTYDYDDWLGGLGDNGANWARLWLNTFTRLAVERTSASPAEKVGLGRYDLENCWRVDYIVKLAEQKGLKVMLCLESFNSLRSKPMYQLWQANPYNAALGGPLATPPEFFTNEQARELFKRRLRYCVARWSSSPAVMCWELWNEVNLVDGYNPAQVAAWHAEMGDYLRDTDPARHLITTSYAGPQGDPAVQALPQMDFIQMHHYGLTDQAQTVTQWQREKQKYGRPAFFGEIGIDWQGKVEREDKQGVALHNSLWAGLMSGAAGTPMTWWWDSYVHPYNLYGLFKPVSQFAALIGWVRDPQPVETAVELAPGETDMYGEGLLSAGRRTWSNTQYGPVTVEMAPDRLPARDTYDTILHGLRNHKEWHNPQTFRGTWPVAGKFAVVVDGVSYAGGGKLQIRLDGRVTLERDMPAQTTAQAIHTYDGAYEIEVPAGAHEIVVENVGPDWITANYRLGNFVSGTQRLRVLGLGTADAVWLWAQNTGHIWPLLRAQKAPEPTPKVLVRVAGLKSGRYVCREFDTRTGQLGEPRTVIVRQGEVAVEVARLTDDVAYIVQRMR